MSAGVKYDGQKDRWYLMPWDALREIVKVFTFGALKYTDFGWKTVPKLRERYLSALMRHMVAREQKLHDEETGLLHSAHMGCCILILIWSDLHMKKRKR